MSQSVKSGKSNVNEVTDYVLDDIQKMLQHYQNLDIDTVKCFKHLVCKYLIDLNHAPGY